MSRKLLAIGLGLSLAIAAFLVQLRGDTEPAVSAIERLPVAKGSGSAADGKAARGELIVRFAPSADAPDRSRLREDAETELERGLPLSGLQLLKVKRGQSVRAAVAKLERSREVRYAEPNFRRFAAATANDTYFGHQWGLHNTGQSLGGSTGTPDADVDAPEAWDTTTRSAEVTVAVVDSGVDLDHPDLRSEIWTNPGEQGDGRETNGVDDDRNGLRDDWRGWDWVDSDNLPADANGHGTHVAGTIAARGNDSFGVAGMAWRSRVMPLRVLDPAGSGTVADAVLAYRYAATRGAKVVNASLGGDSFSRAEADAIDAAPNTLFVVAAGNGGSDGVGDDNDAVAAYPCSHTAANLVCVAASDRRDAPAPFSNYGSKSVDLAAPGVEILSTRPAGGFAFLDGTSMATPHVAGAAALLFALRAGGADTPSLTAVKAALLDGVDARSGWSARSVTGGRLNVERSLRVLNPAAAVQPAPSSPSAPPSSTPPSVPGPVPSTRSDRGAPGLSLMVPRRQRLRSALIRGVRIRTVCSEPCRLSARLEVGPATARRARLTRARRGLTVGRGSASLGPAGATVRIRFTRAARRRLRALRAMRATIRLVARDAAGNARSLNRRITLRR